MRRLRNIPPALAPAAMGRLVAAIVASLVAHLFLICGFTLPDASRSAPGEVILHARLEVARTSADTALTQRVVPRVASARAAVAPVGVVADASRAEVPGGALPSVESSPAPTEAPLASEAVQANPAMDTASQDNAAAAADLPDPVHYEASELDVYPRPLRPVQPAYPESAPAQLAGAVTLKVIIDAGGRVVSASVVDSTSGGIFDEAAHDAIADMAFYPAQRNGRAVGSQMLIKVEFAPRAAR